jgi:hypothetical protein
MASCAGFRLRLSAVLRLRSTLDLPACPTGQPALGARAGRRALHARRRPDTADRLTKLADLRNRWMLTEAEFEAQKAQLLARAMQS